MALYICRYKRQVRSTNNDGGLGNRYSRKHNMTDGVSILCNSWICVCIDSRYKGGTSRGRNGIMGSERA